MIEDTKKVKDKKQGLESMSKVSRFSYSFVSSMKGFDIFAKPIPSFNLKGHSSIESRLGAALTLILTIVFIIYACVKSIHIKSIDSMNFA